ncbi:MAG: TusE/DsrC/DsvC family sulfur relay protein [bacterium]|nr:TusE/DsrC/DsvC family sulfur relay protein [bacterium]
MERVVKGGAYQIDGDGYLQNPQTWNKETAHCLAQREGIDITDIHWEMVDFLREYYHQYEGVPPVKKLMKVIRQRRGCEKWDNGDLKKLYPAGPSRKLCRIAGLPETAGEIANAAVLGGGALI